MLTLVNRVRLAQCERRDLGVEFFPGGGHHLVGAVHRPERRCEWAPGCVFERLTELECGLLTDHPEPLDLLEVVVPIGDGPVTAHQLYGLGALVGDLDRVQEEPAIPRRFGARRGVLRCDIDTNATCFGFGRVYALLADTATHERDNTTFG